MKKIFLLSLSVLLCIRAVSGNLQIVQDTLKRSQSLNTVGQDTITVTPYFGKTKVKSLGNFAVTGKDRIAFQTYAGLSVLNTLRGHVPNLAISPNASLSTAGLRSSESMFVIDGLPFTPGVSGYYNLNSFEYQNIYALSSGNATALYGGTGSNGAIVLQSKTGENFTRPTVEFNSFSTLAISERSPSISGGLLGTNDGEDLRQWTFTNAIAYLQDFGKIDTRVSYNYTYLPDATTAGEVRSGYHNLKINTGFEITPRLHARLILDDLYTKSLSKNTYNWNGQSFALSSESIKRNLQGNLVLQYRVLDWLKITSQSSIGKLGYETESVSSVRIKEDAKQNHYFANLFTSVNKGLTDGISFTAFAGAQYEKLKIERQYQSNSAFQKSTAENKTMSLFAGARLEFKDYLFSDFNYRMDYLSVFAPDNNKAPTYSFNTSFVFSEALDWQNSWFSAGKVRLSIGKASVAIQQGYPYEWPTAGSSNSIPNPGLHASSKQIFESGMDLSFIGNRLTLNTSFFSDHHDQIPAVVPYPGTTGYYYATVNVGVLNTTGWEVVLGGTPVKKNNFSMDTKLIWSTYKTTMELPYSTNSGNNGYPPIRGGIIFMNPGQTPSPQGVSLGNPYPDWTGSILNQIAWKNFFASFLINLRQGGVFYSADYSSITPVFSMQDGTFAKLRDLSLGYRLSSSLLSKLKIREAQVSLSGRNLWTIYSKSENDVESSQGTLPQKSTSLSLTLMF